MKIQEYDARQLFKQFGIPTSDNGIVKELSQVKAVFERYANPTVICKVQVLMGGRGKAGGVKRLHSVAELEEMTRAFLGKPFSTAQSAGESKIVRSLIVTQDIPIQEEYYLGAVIDRSKKSPVLLFCKEGGVDIEELAATRPEAIKKIHFMPSHLPTAESILPVIQKECQNPEIPRQIADIAAKLAKLFVEKDCSIAEINPLALTPGNKILALDAKIVFDDNALFRHDDLKVIKDPDEEDDREKKAKELGLSYISMKGNVGCLVNGAGLAMATMDMIKLAGGEPANFLDVGGSANADQVREAFKLIVQDDRVEAILVNIFGGIMKCDVIADGIIQASKQINLSVPLVVRLEGTHVEEGRALLKNSGLKIISCNNIKDAAQTAVEEVAKHRKSYVNTR